MKTLILALALLAGCGATTKQIAISTTIATVQTLSAGIEEFTRRTVPEEDRIATDAINACKGNTTRLAYFKCTDAITKPRRAPINRARTAILIYRAALAGGEKITQNELNLTAQAVVEALLAVGIRIVGGGVL